MSADFHHGWVFSEEYPPIHHVGGLSPKHARGLIEPWAYLVDLNRWFEFVDHANDWHTRWPEEVPKKHLAALLLLK